MVELKVKSPCAGQLPVTVGNMTLTEIETGPMWSVSPFKGGEKACAVALKKVGVAWPAVRERTQSAMWFGLDQIMVFADSLPEMPAAITDQSDGWAVVRVTGGAMDVLARLVPVDLRVPAGTVLRSMVGHMTAHITCLGDGCFDVMVMRSMARTLVHDLTTAGQAIAARGASGGHI